MLLDSSYPTGMLLKSFSSNNQCKCNIFNGKVYCRSDMLNFKEFLN